MGSAAAAAWYYGELLCAAYNSSLLGARRVSALASAPTFACQTKSKRRGFTIDALLHDGGEAGAATAAAVERRDESGREALRGCYPDPFRGGNPYATMAVAEAASNRLAKFGCVVPQECRKKSKRFRTVFTRSQARRLEAEFVKQQYMIGSERRQLADSLSLSEGQVKVWFQNRRIKWRRQNYGLTSASVHGAVEADLKMSAEDGCPTEVGDSSLSEAVTTVAGTER